MFVYILLGTLLGIGLDELLSNAYYFGPILAQAIRLYLCAYLMYILPICGPVTQWIMCGIVLNEACTFVRTFLLRFRHIPHN